MNEPCATCGSVHDGACPTEPVAVEPRADEPAEPCPFCGLRHSRRYKCGEWAKLIGAGEAEAAESDWKTPSYSSLPPAADITFTIKPPKKPPSRLETLSLRVALGLLAAVGAGSIILFVVGRIGGSAVTTAQLPDCSVARLSADVNKVLTVQAEANSAVLLRVDQVNALQLKSSPDCPQQLMELYTEYLGAQVLCLDLPASDACKSRDEARSSLAAALSGASQ